MPRPAREAWQQHLGDPIRGGSLPCGNIDPSGITSTPVIDPSTATLYAVGFVQPGRHVLWALDTATGAIRWQRTIDPPALSPRVHQQRSALTLSKGRVYVPYGGLYGDCGDYRGWVVASSADGKGDLLSYQVKASREGGIWAPGGAVVDPSGNLFVAVGNAEGSGFNYGNSVIRLTPDLAQADYWAPSNWAALNASDTDVGSITPALLADGLVFQAGKAGIGYLIHSSPMGGVGGEVFSARVCNGLDYGAVAYAPPFLYVPCRYVGVTALAFGSGRFSVAWKVAGGGNTPVVAGGWLWTIGGPAGAAPGVTRQRCGPIPDDPARRRPLCDGLRGLRPSLCPSRFGADRVRVRPPRKTVFLGDRVLDLDPDHDVQVAHRNDGGRGDRPWRAAP